MTLVNPKPATWATGELLTAAQLNLIGTQLPYALDGSAGGTYSPSGHIVLPGAYGVQWGATRYPALTSRTEYRPVPPTAVLNTSSRWSFQDSTLTWRQTSITDGGALLFPIPLIDGATLGSLDATFDGNLGGGGSHGALPASMPGVLLYKLAVATGTVSVVGSTTDSSASTGVYDGVHTVSVSASEAIDLSSAYNIYYAGVTGESGANASANSLCLLSLRVAWIVTSLRP